MMIAAQTDAFEALLFPRDPAPFRLGDAVVDRLTQAILEGQLKPGDPIPSEGKIAGAFGISKQIAREAIRELATMGLLHIQQGKVTRVREISAEPLGRFFKFAVASSERGLVEAIELRCILELPIARFAAERATSETIRPLEEAFQRMATSLADVPAFIEADLDFHDALAELSGNSLLKFQMDGLESLIRTVMEMFNSSRSRSKSQWVSTLQRHEAIVEALRSNDPDAAEVAMDRHFVTADSAIRDLYPESLETEMTPRRRIASRTIQGG